MESLFKWIATGKCDEKGYRQVEALVDEFPYFFPPRLLCLKRTFDADRAAYPEFLKQHAVRVPDFKLLYRYLHHLPPFGESMTRFPAIDSAPYLAPVYRLEDEFTEKEEDTEDPVDIFIREKPEMPRPTVAVTEKKEDNEPPGEGEEEFFTETLAKIYLKQKLYDKAIATYMKLSLKYPEKSISFARSIEEINELKHNTK
jgi:hypothetical protein